MTLTANSEGARIYPASPQGLRSPLSINKRFPQKIALAITAITTSPALTSLSCTAKHILAFVVRLAECTDPMKPSWAFKATIAKEIGVSESTVYRGLSELTQAELIERLAQERHAHNGLLSVAKIRLTRKVCVYLGLINDQCCSSKGADNDKKTTSKFTYKHPSLNLKDGHNNTLLLANQNNQFLKKQSDQPEKFFIKIANRKIPQELAWLVQKNDLSLTGLLSLMGLARQAGHFLSDIVSRCQTAIQPHTGRALYAYLRALIAKPIDYGYLRAQKEKEQVQQDQEKAEKAHREKTIKEGIKTFRGRTFLSTEGIRYSFEDESGIKVAFQRDGRWYTGYTPIHQTYKLITAIKSGKLREIVKEEKLSESGGLSINKLEAKLQASAYIKKMQSIFIKKGEAGSLPESPMNAVEALG